MFLGKIYQLKERRFNVSDMDGAPDTEATIDVKLIPPGERREVAMSGFSTVYHANDSGEFFPESKADNRKPIESLFMKAVTGWSGFFEDEDGNVPLQFGPSGKKKLLSIVPEIADFVAECHKKMVEEEAERKAASDENLSKGSSGSGTQTDRTAKPAKK